MRHLLIVTISALLSASCVAQSHPVRVATIEDAKLWTSLRWGRLLHGGQVAFVTRTTGSNSQLNLWHPDTGSRILEAAAKSYAVAQHGKLIWIDGNQALYTYSATDGRIEAIGSSTRLQSLGHSVLAHRPDTEPTLFHNNRHTTFDHILAEHHESSARSILLHSKAPNGIAATWVTPDSVRSVPLDLSIENGSSLLIRTSPNGTLAILADSGTTCVIRSFGIDGTLLQSTTVPDEITLDTGSLLVLNDGTCVLRDAGRHQPRSGPRILAWDRPRLAKDSVKSTTLLLANNGLASFELEGEVGVLPGGGGPSILCVTDSPYLPSNEWDFPGRLDAFVLDVATGRSTMIAEGIRSLPSWSPDAKAVDWWSRKDLTYRRTQIPGGQHSEFAIGTPAAEQHSIPAQTGLYERPLQTGSDLYLLGMRDFWCLTEFATPEHLLDRRQDPIELDYALRRTAGRFDDIVLKVTDQPTRGSELLVLNQDNTARSIYRQDDSIQVLDRDERWALLARQRFDTPPDLWRIDLTTGQLDRITTLNPQQAKFRWGTSTVIEWVDPNGSIMRGDLLMPDHVPEGRQVPMIVYFYENEFENRHSYFTPRARSSLINPTLFVSAGYAVFMPNVRLEIGSAIDSATESLIAGTDTVLARGDVDPERIGLMGHSYGAYLAAGVLTKTDRFRAAVLSAPVTEPISSYLSIREDSTRMAQYEAGQARIGRSLWEDPTAYLDQSPVLRANEITSPVLIMSNDNDEAVPAAQGMALFLALRRLGRPAWIISYPGERHALSKPEHKADWAIRMQEFFDTHLSDTD